MKNIPEPMNPHKMNQGIDARRTSLPLFFFLPFLLALVACDESPLEPTLGSGDRLSAVIDGSSVTFDFEESLSNYNEGTRDGRIVGATSTPPIKSLTVTFRGVDLDNDTFPMTLTGGAVGILLVTSSDTGEDLEYRPPSNISASDATITITATNGTIVDGTFSGTLYEADDSTDQVTITNGSFSALLSRD